MCPEVFGLAVVEIWGLRAVLEGPQGVERPLGALTPKPMLPADFVPLIINPRARPRLGGWGWGEGGG